MTKKLGKADRAYAELQIESAKMNVLQLTAGHEWSTWGQCFFFICSGLVHCILPNTLLVLTSFKSQPVHYPTPRRRRASVPRRFAF